jgi:hypothetical protein
MGATAFVQIRHRQVIRRQLLLAEASIATVVDYSESGAMAQADLAARAQLDALSAENLDTEEARAASALSNYLAAVESLESSNSIGTTQLREPIAEAALKKAHEAMRPFHE